MKGRECVFVLEGSSVVQTKQMSVDAPCLMFSWFKAEGDKRSPKKCTQKMRHSQAATIVGGVVGVCGGRNHQIRGSREVTKKHSLTSAFPFLPHLPPPPPPPNLPHNGCRPRRFLSGPARARAPRPGGRPSRPVLQEGGPRQDGAFLWVGGGGGEGGKRPAPPRPPPIGAAHVPISRCGGVVGRQDAWRAQGSVGWCVSLRRGTPTRGPLPPPGARTATPKPGCKRGA